MLCSDNVEVARRKNVVRDVHAGAGWRTGWPAETALALSLMGDPTLSCNALGAVPGPTGTENTDVGGDLTHIDGCSFQGTWHRCRRPISTLGVGRLVDAQNVRFPCKSSASFLLVKQNLEVRPWQRIL